MENFVVCIFSDPSKYLEAIDKITGDKMHPSARSLQEQIENYYRQIDRLQANLDRLENLPEEPPYDSVIYFQKNFGDDNGKVYTYVAVRVKHIHPNDTFLDQPSKQWWLTGLHSKPVTWEELLEYIAKGESEPPKIWIVTEWSDEL